MGLIVAEAIEAIALCQQAIQQKLDNAILSTRAAGLNNAETSKILWSLASVSQILDGRHGAWCDALNKLKSLLPENKQLFYNSAAENLPHQQEPCCFLKQIGRVEQLYGELSSQLLYIGLMFFHYINHDDTDAHPFMTAYNCCSEILANINIGWLRGEIGAVCAQLLNHSDAQKFDHQTISKLIRKIIENLTIIEQHLENLSNANNASKAHFSEQWNRCKYCDELQIIIEKISIKCRRLLRSLELEVKREKAIRILQQIEQEDRDAKANRQFSQRLDQFVHVPEQYDEQDVDEALDSQADLVEDIGNAVTNEETKGTIFAGPPGVGKSFLAQAIAQRIGIPCFFIQCQALLTEYKNCLETGINSVISAIHNKYCKAADGKCLVVIDEVDARDDSTDTNANSTRTKPKVGKNFCSILSQCNQPNMAIIGTTNDDEVLADAILSRLNIHKFEELTLEQKRRAYARSLPNIGIRHPHVTVSKDCLNPANIDKFAMQSQGFSYRMIHGIIASAVHKARTRYLALSHDLSFIEATKLGLRYIPKPVEVTCHDVEAAIQDEQKKGNKKLNEKRLSQATTWAEKSFPYLFRTAETLIHEWIAYKARQVPSKEWYEEYLFDPAKSLVKMAALPAIGAGLAAGGGAAVAAGVAAGAVGLTAAASVAYDLKNKK